MPRPRSSASRRGSRPSCAPARSTPNSSRWSAARACTPCARRPAAPTSTNAGRTARPPSSSAASSAPGAATSARSTPASPPNWTATNRAGSPRACRRWGCGTPRSTGVARDDLPDGGAWLYAETVRQIHALNPNTGVELLAPDFNGVPELLERGLRVASGGVRAQRRNGAADLQADPARVPLPAQPRRHHRRARLRPGHQEQPDPGHGRDPRRGAHRAGRPARGRLRHRHHHPVPAPVAAPPPGGPVGASRRVRRVHARSPRASDSPACWPVRWCARPTGRAGSYEQAARGAGRPPRHPYPDPMAKSRKPAQTKAAKAEAKAARKAASKQRRSQLWQAFQIQRKEDKRLLPYMVGRVRHDRCGLGGRWASSPAVHHLTC